MQRPFAEVPVRRLLSFALSLCACAAEAPAPHRCAADGAPTTFEEAAAWLSSLPAPVDAPCVVAGLARPLGVEATVGTVSAQPADGDASPRVFLVSGPLRLSLVGSGEGAGLLEFGELTQAGFTRKGELALPLTGPVTAGDMVDHTLDPTYGTRCVLCHARLGDDPRGGEVSEALRPAPGQLVDAAALNGLADACGDEPGGRCDLLRALAAGPLVDARSPEDWRPASE